jgi:signal transduction histidine kinase
MTSLFARAAPDLQAAPAATILVLDQDVEAYRGPLDPVARVLGASSPGGAIDLLRAELASGAHVQAVFVDLGLLGGLGTLRELLALDPDMGCVVVTPGDAPFDEIGRLLTGLRCEDWEVLERPFAPGAVLHRARHAVASWWRRRRDAGRAAQLERQIAESDAELARSHAATAGVLAELRGANDRLRVEMVERTRLEDERRLANKLEGIGQLAAGIAHEINTPTQYILSNAEMLELVLAEWLPAIETLATAARRWPDEAGGARARELIEQLPVLDSDLNEAVTSILSGAKSIARIVGAMREFSRSDAPEMRPADLNRAIRATLEVVRHEYRHVADVELALGELPQVHCHVGEIQQVLANLIVNAAHAIDRREPKTQGTIRIESLHDKARGRVEIAVSDDGIGIPPENRDRVFDPFFTTKPVGRGTGQGLAIAHNVVARHSGQLTFDSTPGVGTRFLVSMPVRGPVRDGA